MTLANIKTEELALLLKRTNLNDNFEIAADDDKVVCTGIYDEGVGEVEKDELCSIAVAENASEYVLTSGYIDEDHLVLDDIASVVQCVYRLSQETATYPRPSLRN